MRPVRAADRYKNVGDRIHYYMRAGDLVVNIVGGQDAAAGELGVLLEDSEGESDVYTKVRVLFPSGVRNVYRWEVEPIDDFDLLLGMTR